MRIYKIFTREDWLAFRKSGTFAGSRDDLRDGYLHFSTLTQLLETAGRYYANQQGLVLAEFDADALGTSLRWESARRNQLFPHLYRPLQAEDVIISWPLPYEEGIHIFPAALGLQS
jgi:uncharacterized protein (DUF952 family)